MKCTVTDGNKNTLILIFTSVLFGLRFLPAFPSNLTCSFEYYVLDCKPIYLFGFHGNALSSEVTTVHVRSWGEVSTVCQTLMASKDPELLQIDGFK